MEAIRAFVEGFRGQQSQLPLWVERLIKVGFLAVLAYLLYSK